MEQDKNNLLPNFEDNPEHQPDILPESEVEIKPNNNQSNLPQPDRYLSEDELKRLRLLSTHNDPYDIINYVVQEFPEVTQAGLEMFKNQMLDVVTDIQKILPDKKLSAPQKAAMDCPQGIICGLSVLKMEKLMQAWGIWSDDDIALYEHYNTQLSNRQANGINMQLQKQGAPFRLTAMGRMPFTDVIDIAQMEGHIFSHSQDTLKAVIDFYRDLKLYELGMININKHVFGFENGTPPLREWGKNKPLNDMEGIVLYYSYMVAGNLMICAQKDYMKLVKKAKGQPVEKPDFKYSGIYQLGQSIARNRLVSSALNVTVAARECLYENPEQFVQVCLMNRFVCDHINQSEPVPEIIREMALIHLIRETRRSIEDYYQNDKETARMVLSWYNYGTKSVEKRLSEVVRQSEMVIQSNDNPHLKQEKGKTRE